MPGQKERQEALRCAPLPLPEPVDVRRMKDNAGPTRASTFQLELAASICGDFTGHESPEFRVRLAPDTRYLAFTSGRKLKKVDVTGGPPQTLCDIPGGGPPFTTWSREDVILFSGRHGLWRVSASGGVPVRVTALETSRQEIEHIVPQFLPDGKH